MGAGGLGVGNLSSGKVVFIPRTAVGDVVRVRLKVEKPKWARGEGVQWVERGPSRQEPPCPHYHRCDGCSLQHIEYEEQLAWKARWVGDALRRIGGLELDDPPMEASPRTLRYRNRMSFTLRRLKGKGVVAGLRELGRPERVLDLGPECLLPEDPLSRTWRDLRQAWGEEARHLPRGPELRLTLWWGGSEASLLVGGGQGRGDPDALLARVPDLTSVWREDAGGTRRHLGGRDSLSTVWAGERLALNGGGFVQVNRACGELLHSYLLEEAGHVEGRKIVDAYCGVGVLGRALAGRGARVTGIDLDPGGQEGGVDGQGFRLVVGRVEEELEKELPADLILLNPPRTGLDGSIPALLRERVPDRLLYVSCDPATLARDLKALQGALEVERVRCFDLFPQTQHVETVVSLRGANGGER